MAGSIFATIRCRVKRGIAENVILDNVKNHLLGDDVVKYMRQSVRVSMREYQKQATSESKSVDRLKARQREIDRKLDHVTDAVESIGIRDTLRDRLLRLDDERKSIESAIVDAAKASPALDPIPDILPGLVDAWCEIVEGMADIGSNPHARTSDVQAAREQLQALLSPVVLEARDGVL